MRVEYTVVVTSVMLIQRPRETTKLHTEVVEAADSNGIVQSTRHVPRKIWRKTVMGKERERNAFFPFPFKEILGPVFFPFMAVFVKNGRKKG